MKLNLEPFSPSHQIPSTHIYCATLKAWQSPDECLRRASLEGERYHACHVCKGKEKKNLWKPKVKGLTREIIAICKKFGRESEKIRRGMCVSCYQGDWKKKNKIKKQKQISQEGKMVEK